MKRIRIAVLACGIVAVLAAGVLLASRTQWYQSVPLPRIAPNILPQRATRPYGMAPVAWKAFLRACQNSKIHPFRIGQTIGDNPLSVGYHKRDGVLIVGNQRVDYCAAADLGVDDLSDLKINQFLQSLAAQGFAAWYRHEGKWKGREHIHAIYAFLPMKAQLQVQLSQWLREQKRAGKKVSWEKKLRAQDEKLRHWML